MLHRCIWGARNRALNPGQCTGGVWQRASAHPREPAYGRPRGPLVLPAMWPRTCCHISWSAQDGSVDLRPCAGKYHGRGTCSSRANGELAMTRALQVPSSVRLRATECHRLQRVAPALMVCPGHYRYCSTTGRHFATLCIPRGSCLRQREEMGCIRPKAGAHVSTQLCCSKAVPALELPAQLREITGRKRFLVKLIHKPKTALSDLTRNGIR